MDARKLFTTFSLAGTAAIATAQVPDMVTAFDAGSRALALGSSDHITGADTLSGYYNPAGLGYLNRPQIGLTIRNFPESNSIVTGDLIPQGGERLRSEGSSGPNGLGHLGFATPLKSDGSRGTISVALTAAGQLRDNRLAGNGLTEGGTPAPNYQQLLKNKTDIVSLAYGRALNDGGLSWGVGLLYARNNTVNNSSGVPSGNTFYNEQSSGFGGIAGLMFVPKSNPNLSFGVSYRSEIKLKSSSGNILLYDTIPARLGGGVALRRDGFRGGRDYLVLSAEVNHYFEGSSSIFFDREAQTVFGTGLEYNFQYGGNRIPIRLGYQFVPAGGNQFGSRNSFTYGIGFRPSNSDWGVDLSFGRPNGGGQDASLSLTYRFK